MMGEGVRRTKRSQSYWSDTPTLLRVALCTRGVVGHTLRTPQPHGTSVSSVRCHLAGTATAQTFEQLPTAIIKKKKLKKNLQWRAMSGFVYFFLPPAPKVGFWPVQGTSCSGSAVPGWAGGWAVCPGWLQQGKLLPWAAKTQPQLLLHRATEISRGLLYLPCTWLLGQVLRMGVSRGWGIAGGVQGVRTALCSHRGVSSFPPAQSHSLSSLFCYDQPLDSPRVTWIWAQTCFFG